MLITTDHKAVVLPVGLNDFDLHQLWEITESIGRLNLHGNPLIGIGQLSARMAMSNLLPLVYNLVYNMHSCLTSLFLKKPSDYPREIVHGWHLSLKLFIKRNPGSKFYTAKQRMSFNLSRESIIVSSKAGGKRGSMGWRQNVSEHTRRKDKAVVSLDDKFLEQLLIKQVVWRFMQGWEVY